jgi:hypothetical protein
MLVLRAGETDREFAWRSYACSTGSRSKYSVQC